MYTKNTQQDKYGYQMFTLKSDAYIYLVHFLWSSQYKENAIVSKAIKNLKMAVENHDQDLTAVLAHLDEVMNDPQFDDEFKNELKFAKTHIQHIDFNQKNPSTKFENPLRRQLDSMVAINLLMQPTTLMMNPVNDISKGIIAILENYDTLPIISKEAIDMFLLSLQSLRGPGQYQAAISLGAFKDKPTVKNIIDFLKSAQPNDLAAIMHIHFKFALIASRRVPLSSTPKREPVGKFKEIIEQLEPAGYETYFAQMASEDVNVVRNGYLANEVIYSSPIYSVDKLKGRAGELDYTNTTRKLGLMRDNQVKYQETFPTMPLPWVADAKAQMPNFQSAVTLDMIENDAIYVGGPSGMASLFLHLMENLGNFSSIAEKQSYLAAICGYIVGGGFHSLHEVLAPAAYCLDLIPGYEVTIPDVTRKTKGAAPKFACFFDAVSQFDNEFPLLIDAAWEKHLQYITPILQQNSFKTLSTYTNNIEKHIEYLKTADMGNVADNQTVVTLVKKLEGHTNHFLQLPFEEKTKNMKKFQTHCIQEVKHADTELRYNNNWKPFFKNLILAFTGIGILASITSFTARAITGRYAFFDTPTQTKLPQLKILFKELKSEEPETPPINKTR